MCIDVADINERTKHLAIEGKGHKADTPSTKGESNLNNEPNSSKESKGISTGYPTYGNCVETMNVNADSLISKIKSDTYWRGLQIPDEEPIAATHQRLVAWPEFRNDSRKVSLHQVAILSDKAIETFVKQLTKMKKDGYLDCFCNNPEETCSIRQYPKDLFLTLYNTMVKASKKTSNFDLVPIAFIAACIAAAGGFDFSDPKHADILTTLAIESKIYLVVDELYDFIKELKHIIFQFLMDDMGWKRDSELGACVTLREIIDAVDSINATKMHPSINFISLSKHSRDSVPLNSIIDDTDEAINESYELHGLKKGRFTNEDKLWIDKAMMRDFNKLLDDSISITEKKSYCQQTERLHWSSAS